MKLLIVVGARPNFVKVAPLIRECKRVGIDTFLVHTGQHYDYEMSKVFFEELEIPEPDVNLCAGGASRSLAHRLGGMIGDIACYIKMQKPDFVVVVGDVDSTLAGALAANKLGVSLVHIEAGLRSHDMQMVEEVNRVITDKLSDVLFTHSGDADSFLLKEGVPTGKIWRVGNIMIDTLSKHICTVISRKPKFTDYVLATVHRQENVNDKEKLTGIFEAFHEISKKKEVIFICHPNTLNKIGEYNIPTKGLRMHNSISYLGFLELQYNSLCVVTDSGGIQEETSYLGIPCFTLRENTERRVTEVLGTNKVIGTNKQTIVEKVTSFLDNIPERTICRIPLWDGKTAERICSILQRLGVQ